MTSIPGLRAAALGLERILEMCRRVGVQEEGRRFQALPGQCPSFFSQKPGVFWLYWVPEWSLSSVIISDPEVREPGQGGILVPTVPLCSFSLAWTIHWFPEHLRA